MTKVEPLKNRYSFANLTINDDRGVTTEVNGKDKKSKLTITKDGIELAVIVGDVDIESIELEGNTSLRIKDF